MASARRVCFLGFILSAMLLEICSATILTKDQLQNMCYVDKERLIRPRENQNMSGPCSPWKKSCCTSEDSLEIKDGIRLDLNPCGTKMSAQCARHFKRKLCFQHCSPYIGPWLINRNESRRHTNFQFVPLCKSQCERWWEDCKHDMAKQENWYPGANETFEDVVCETIEKKYKDATYFCEHVFGPFEFVVVAEFTSCMTLFSSTHNNQYVAMMYAEKEDLRNRRIFNFSGRFEIIQEKDNRTTPETKFLVLCFFLGGIIAALGFVIGCVMLAKCGSSVRRSASLACLFENREENEYQESELQEA